MEPRPIKPADMDYWAGQQPTPTVIGGPPGEPDCLPCPALITREPESPCPIIRVPYTMSEIELTHLAQGGTLWLSSWGGLPIHMLEVQAPPLLQT